MRLEPREVWEGFNVTYKKNPDGTVKERIMDPITVTAESANLIINPNQVEEAVERLKETIETEKNNISRVLDGLAACDLAASLNVNGETYRGLLNDSSESVVSCASLESLSTRATYTLEKAAAHHNAKQREFNKEAQTKAQRASDTSVKCTSKIPE